MLDETPARLEALAVRAAEAETDAQFEIESQEAEQEDVPSRLLGTTTHQALIADSAFLSARNAYKNNHKKALESLFEKHKKEATAQSEVRIKSETLRARRQVNQAAAKAETELKRALGKTQNELKVRLFDEVKELPSDFTKTDEYLDYLCSKIREAARFADGEEMTIYISPSDKEKQTELEKRTGMTITISEYDFMGGMRAVIRGRNILIDHSFQAAVDYEYHQFSFAAGGAGIE